MKRLDRAVAGNLGDVKWVGEGVSELRIDYGPGYRIYFVERDRHIAMPPIEMDYANDNEAAEIARQYIDSRDIELWQEQRVVANSRVSRPGLAPQKLILPLGSRKWCSIAPARVG